MSHDHPYGKPINVLKFTDTKQVQIDKAELEKMFDHLEVKNRKVVIFSIIGAFRRGKSFFLDYCLRFLYANYPSINNPNNPLDNQQNWMGNGEEPLRGFTWRSGTKRDTTGIIMWSDVFLHTLELTGEKIAIVVMDTQGLFDNETSPADNSRIFALGTLISSIQVLNLVGIIQEDQLQYLQFATEFARFAAADSQGQAGKPFQNLLFLIRDWSNPDEFEFGTEGGDHYLKDVLKVKSDQKPELRSVRQFISSSFEQINCCLLPYPGKTVARVKTYDGRWSKMDEEFKEELQKVIEHLLLPNNVILKKINSKDLKGSEMKEYIDSYFQLFQSDTLPQAQSIYESTIEKQMSILLEKCIDHYKQTIFLSNDLLTEENLHIVHEMSKNKTLIMFKEEKKMGNIEHERKFKVKLEEQMEKLYNEWKDQKKITFEQIKEQKAKQQALYEEQLRLEEEAKEAKHKAEINLIELNKAKELQKIEEEQFQTQKALLEARLEAENQRARAIEAERDAQKAHREALEARLAAERAANASKPKKKWCSIM
ncbi:atlastin-like [Chironomus tepperi]|uniref:atlastin-like n=1 Tax=Chironomus tepperi TaxID=113505 RepID=UPI00391F1CD2